MPAQTASDELASVTPARIPGLVPALWLRTVVLLATGAAIAFTATSHADPHFSLLLIGASLLLLGIATVLEFVVLRSQTGSWLIATRAVVTLVAGAAMFALLSALDNRIGDDSSLTVINPKLSAEFAMLAAQILAVWAIIAVAVTLTQLYCKTLPKNVAIPSAALSAILALSVLLFSDDFVAIIGFFGAYAVVRAVFLGISVFDMKNPAENDRSLVAA